MCFSEVETFHFDSTSISVTNWKVLSATLASHWKTIEKKSMLLTLIQCTFCRMANIFSNIWGCWKKSFWHKSGYRLTVFKKHLSHIYLGTVLHETVCSSLHFNSWTSSHMVWVSSWQFVRGTWLHTSVGTFWQFSMGIWLHVVTFKGVQISLGIWSHFSLWLGLKKRYGFIHKNVLSTFSVVF